MDTGKVVRMIAWAVAGLVLVPAVQAVTPAAAAGTSSFTVSGLSSTGKVLYTLRAVKMSWITESSQDAATGGYWVSAFGKKQLTFTAVTFAIRETAKNEAYLTKVQTRWPAGTTVATVNVKLMSSGTCQLKWTMTRAWISKFHTSTSSTGTTTLKLTYEYEKIARVSC